MELHLKDEQRYVHMPHGLNRFINKKAPFSPPQSSTGPLLRFEQCKELRLHIESLFSERQELRKELRAAGGSLRLGKVPDLATKMEGTRTLCRARLDCSGG
jgi:hypothetical protein